VIALAGQPNVGKSTVFNMLTGLNQHVGNWPGKTVECRTGELVHDGMAIHLVDLPGTYCLTAASPEETITRDYIMRERPDVVLVIINAASLERNLYLVAELLALPAPLVIGLNMMDVAHQEGFEVDAEVLSAALGLPVIPMIASRNVGVHELIDAAVKVARDGPTMEPNRPEIEDDHREVLEEILELIHDRVPEPYIESWVALKLLEGDEQVTGMMREALEPALWQQVEAILRDHEDAIIAVASGRYDWIRRMTRAALRRPRVGRVTLTYHLDNIATHPFWGLLVLAAVLALVFGLTYSVGGPLQELLEGSVVSPLAELAEAWLGGSPAWLIGLVTEGVIGGVGTVLTFLPILLLFFLAMGILEDTGYMARAAYVMDRFMHVIGLHGKSFLPLFLGFGCNVPAIMGARVVESPRGRLLTIMLAPLVPCAARLGIVAVLTPVFFPARPALMAWILTALPLVVLALTGYLAHRVIFRGERAAFIMELPLYHVPNWRTIGISVWERLLAFLQKAATVIMTASVLVWLLASVPTGDIETSVLASIGRFLEPVGALMGLGWRALVALLASFVAKENSIAVLGILYGSGQGGASLAEALRASLTPASGLAFLVVQMLFIPCVSTVAAIRQETASWKWTLLNLVFLGVLSLVGGIVAYQLGVLFLG